MAKHDLETIERHRIESREAAPAAICRTGTSGDESAAALIGHMPPESFDREIREQHYWRFEAALEPVALARLFDLARLERLLNEEALLPYVDVYAEGHLKRLLDMQRKSGLSAREVSLRCFRAGQTIRVRDVERFDQAMSRFVADVERTFAATAQANVYLTPPGQRGFPPHFDITDVFVVQLLGAKEWTIYSDYENRIELPLAATDWNPDRYGPFDTKDTMLLQPGDVLYLPRGTMHAAACVARESMHLTISLVSITYADLMLRAAASAADANVELRRRVPLSLGAADLEIEAIAAAARDLMLAELQRVDIGSLLRYERDSLRAAREPVPCGGFESAISSLLANAPLKSVSDTI